MMQNFLRKHKRWMGIVVILILLIVIILPILLTCDAIGAKAVDDVPGMYREMSVWFELLVTFLVTVGGFFLAMQFNGILEKQMEAEKEDDVWVVSVELSLEEIRRKIFENASINRLTVLCDALLEACKIDSIAISTIRKSPFYRQLYFVLKELHTLPIEKYDLSFCNLLNFQKSRNSEEQQKKDIIDAICVWLIGIVLLESIDFSKHKLFEENTIISKKIKEELDTYFCFDEYVDDSKKVKSEGYKILQQVIAKLSNVADIENYLNNVAKQFCCFLKSDDGKPLKSKKEIIKKCICIESELLAK